MCNCQLVLLSNFCRLQSSLKSKYGEYKAEFIRKSENQIQYKRDFMIKEGKYTKDEYESYRLFMEQVSRNDNAKMILTKN